MKHTWTRDNPPIALSREALSALLAPRFPEAGGVLHVERVSTGLVNTLFRVHLERRAAPLCVKIAQRGEVPGALEYAAARLAASRLPGAVPTTHALLPPSPLSHDHAVAISDWVPGVRLDTLQPAPPLGRRLGELMARLHACARFPRSGLLAPEGDGLAVVEPFDVSPDGLRGYAARVLGPDTAGRARIGVERSDALLRWLEEGAQRLAPHVTGPAALCHGDFGAENLLYEAGSDALHLIDWEFACAAPPVLDLGHLLRTPLSGDFSAELERGYRAAGGALEVGWEAAARLMDLFAWLSFLERPRLGADVIAEAARRVDALLAV